MWADRSTNADGKPPIAVKVVKLSITEADGSVGSAVSFVDDGIMLEQV